MSDTKTRPGGGGSDKGSKRNLPSWMSSRENQNEGHGKNPTGNGEGDKCSEVETPKKAKGQKDRTPSKQIENDGSTSVSGSESRSFSKLLEGVVFVLSGFVNPERSILRSQALEMGAEYQPDWNQDCTLLVCAFPNTPKFRQVEADCGTIVSKDWISECYSQRKLIDIESYLMHVGKPWRRGNKSDEINEVKIHSPSKKSKKPDERGLPSKPTASTKPKGKDLDPAKKLFPPSEVKKWAIDDLNKTIQWLESQEEKPDPSEMTKIAAEGILTCLQDVICAVEGKQDVSKATEEWNFIPRVVEELAKCDVSGNNKSSLSKEDLHRMAMDCKRIYEVELHHSDDELKKKLRIDEKQRSINGKTKAISSGAVEYDSDETIEMTEDEIDLAYKTLASNVCKS